MNHQKTYDNIINKAKSENRKRLKKIDENYVYYENHHIIPKCLGGLNDKENLVLLTAREHYVCHKLLTYIYPKNDKIVNAFFRMTFSKNIGCVISSRDYKFARELMNSTPKSKETRDKIKQNHAKYWKGKHPSKETIEKLKEAASNRVVSDTTRKNISKSRKGIKFSKQHCENIKKSKLGENNPNYGKQRSKDTIEKIKNSNIGKKRSEQTKNNIGNSLKGRKLSEEHIKNRTKSQTGKKRSKESCEKIRIKAIERENKKRLKRNEIKG